MALYSLEAGTVQTMASSSRLPVVLVYDQQSLVEVQSSELLGNGEWDCLRGTQFSVGPDSQSIYTFQGSC